MLLRLDRAMRQQLLERLALLRDLLLEQMLFHQDLLCLRHHRRLDIVRLLPGPGA